MAGRGADRGRLERYPDWLNGDGCLRRTYRLATHTKALQLAQSVVEVAERMEVEIQLVLRRHVVAIEIRHDPGAVTPNDVTAAIIFEKILWWVRDGRFH